MGAVNILKEFKHLIDSYWTAIYGLFHPIENKVLFESFGGKQYSDNTRAISEKLHELYPEYQIVWAINNPKQIHIIPSYVKTVSRIGKDFYRELATSFCFVTNVGITQNIHKRKEQFFIQTWHGDRALKKVLYAEFPDGKGMTPVIDNKVTDLCVAASDLGIQQYKNAFRYNGEILNVGMPRNDILVNGNPSIDSIVRKELGIPRNTKILIYAPTFRDNKKEKQNVDVDLLRTINALEVRGDKWVCLIRAHSASSGLDFSNYSDKFINASSYPDMADLLAVGDMLLTDYSSSAGDFILRNKPMIVLMFDKEDYSENYRKFNYDCDQEGSPFLVAHSQEELEKIILTYSEEDYSENCKKIIDYFHICETGKSSIEICKRIHLFYLEHYKRSIYQ